MVTYKRLEITEGGGATVVRICDRHIADLREIEELGEELFRLAKETKHKRLVLDFSQVDYLSSALIGKLIALNSRARARKGSVRLCGIRPGVNEVFRTCKLNRVFSINKDAAEALPSF